MARYSACIEMLFPELPFVERVKAALDCGYDAVEFWQWHTKDIPALAATGATFALALVDSADDAVRAEYGRIGMLRKESPELFARVLEETILALKPLNVGLIVAGPGQAQPDLSREEQEANIAACLRRAEPVLEKYGVQFAIEPLNPIDHRGCYLQEAAQAYRIVRDAGAQRAGVLFDIYHQQVTEGNLIQRISDGIDLIRHFHIADVPGRHQPGTGEINYRNVLSAIEKTGYSGYLGCEFIPTCDTRSASEYILSL